MKKLFLPVLGLIGVTALASGIAASQDVSVTELFGFGPQDAVATVETAPAQSKAVKVSGSELALYNTSTLNMTPGAKFTPPSDSVLTELKAQTLRPMAITSVDDIAGSYVQNSLSLTTGSGDIGNATNITRVENTDSVIIERFWTNNNPQLAVKAYVDVKAGTITIPSQVLYNDTDLESKSPSAHVILLTVLPSAIPSFRV